MTTAPRILVLTLSFGSGHLRSASAVARELARQAPDAEVILLDALEHCRLLFRAAYVWPYWAMVRHAPRVWARLFASRLRRGTRRTAPDWAFRLGCASTFRAIAQFRPDVILATEVAACEIAALARRRRVTAAAIVNIVTDHHAEPAWVTSEVDAYAVPTPVVRQQLCEWGARFEQIVVSGTPTDAAFERTNPQTPTEAPGRADARPVVLLMGGGMGPTRMDRVAARLGESGHRMRLVAITGHDRRARRRLERVRPVGDASLEVVGWTDDVAAWMRTADLIVTKPGGLTTTEAALCGVPLVMFDAIPGPEQRNAACVVEAGAGILTTNADEAAAATLSLLRNEERRRAMAASARALATAGAARTVAQLALSFAARAASGAAESRSPRTHERVRAHTSPSQRPTVILTIRNGAGHTRVAEAIADAIRRQQPHSSPVVLEVSDYMARVVYLTHVTIYLWLVKHLPQVWDRIDRLQKRQPHTSPEWYYRRGCRRLFDRVAALRPVALVATEVGCCEMAALIKRDLSLECPLVAVNGEYDGDRAWVQPEVDLHVVATTDVSEQLRTHGAPPNRLRVWGVPLAQEFAPHVWRGAGHTAACNRLALEAPRATILVNGGSEGLGPVEAVTRRLLQIDRPRVHVVVLTGRNERLKRRCERLARDAGGERVRVLGWTTRIPALMAEADLMVSKLGHTFDEALASGLPIVALAPPPGSERVQYQLLDSWGVGRAVRTVEEMGATVERLLGHTGELEAMRNAACLRGGSDAAAHIAAWIAANTSAASSVPIEEGVTC